jgi:hypothetical protein
LCISIGFRYISVKIEKVSLLFSEPEGTGQAGEGDGCGPDRCAALRMFVMKQCIFLENFGRNLEKVLAIFTRIGYAKNKETASFKSPQSFS